MLGRYLENVKKEKSQTQCEWDQSNTKGGSQFVCL
jgi:hypothetical protein